MPLRWPEKGYRKNEFCFYFTAFPGKLLEFCDRLRANGVNVLGIGDAPYETLPPCSKAH